MAKFIITLEIFLRFLYASDVRRGGDSLKSFKASLPAFTVSEHSSVHEITAGEDPFFFSGGVLEAKPTALVVRSIPKSYA